MVHQRWSQCISGAGWGLGPSLSHCGSTKVTQASLGISSGPELIHLVGTLLLWFLERGIIAEIPLTKTGNQNHYHSPGSSYRNQCHYQGHEKIQEWSLHMPLELMCLASAQARWVMENDYRAHTLYKGPASEYLRLESESYSVMSNF